MMKLSTMKKVVATVNDEWQSPVAEKILERWGYDHDSVYYFRSSANFVFVFHKDGKKHFLRFSDSCERKLQTIEAEIEILHYLRDQPVHTAQPVPSLNNKYIEIVETKIGTFYAVVFEALQGEQYDIEDINEEHYFIWGRTLGQLHASLKRMPETYRRGRPSWQEQLNSVNTMLTTQEPFVQKEWELVTKWAEQKLVSEQTFGLIHYDFELDNLCWQNEKVSILDFDDCVNHWYVADIAYSLRELSEYDVDLENQFVQAFIRGYTQETELDMSLLKDLKWFMRMHNIVTFATLLRTVDIQESPDDPEWLIHLREDLLGYIEEYRASFKKRVTEN